MKDPRDLHLHKENKSVFVSCHLYSYGTTCYLPALQVKIILLDSETACFPSVLHVQPDIEHKHERLAKAANSCYSTKAFLILTRICRSVLKSFIKI